MPLAFLNTKIKRFYLVMKCFQDCHILYKLFSFSYIMNPKNYSGNKIVVERIDKLFCEAESSFKEHPDLSKRYVVMARKLSTKYKVKFNSSQKKSFCKNCNAYLKNGVNSKIRLTSGRIVQTCLECGAV